MFNINLIPYLVIMAVMGSISVYFISLVIVRQLGLFKIPIAPKINKFRKTLFKLAIAVFLGNAVPLMLDLYTMADPLGRPEVVHTTSFVYAIFLHSGLAISAYLIWTLYQLAEDVDSHDARSDHTLINEDSKNQ